jgi:hypothetical protein
MAERPSVGDSNWGTTLNSHLAVSLETDGTLKDSVVAAKFTPPTYAGEESVTLPNGLIMKFGYVDTAAAGGTVTFATPFSTLVNISLSSVYSNSTGNAVVDSATPATASSFKWLKNNNAIEFYWMAIGY